MKSDTSYFLIGLFVITACAVLAVSIVVLSGDKEQGEIVNCETLTGDSVNGLEIGADVLFRGVKVGKVGAIEIASNVRPHEQQGRGNEILIQFTISPLTAGYDIEADELRENVEAAVSRGLRVRLASSGLSPQAHLELNIDETVAARFDSPKPYWTDAEYVFIPSVPSRLEGLAKSLESTFDRLSELDLEGVIGDARTAIQAIEKGVEDLRLAKLSEEASGVLDSAKRLLDDTGGKIDVVAEDARTTLKSIENAAGKLDERLSDPKIDQLLTHIDEVVVEARDLLRSPRIGSILDNVDGVLVEVKTAVSKAEATIDSADVLVRDARQLVRGNDREIAAIIDNLRQVTQSLTNLGRTLERYPSLALFGNPPKRKAKENDQ